MYFSLVFTCLLAFAGAQISREDVTYVFYSRANRDGFFSRSTEDPKFETILKALDANLPTVFLIHGWMDSYESSANSYVKESILTKIDANIIKVDWSPLANQGYIGSRDSVQPVAALAAELAQAIIRQYDYSYKNLTLVGFSLGAHIAGNIGKNLGGQIGTIVALDPAGPLINSNDVAFSVTPTDAQYVQVIHTNGGTLGMIEPVGHADFYPNGGARQPGCGLDLLGSCSHNRAWQYFAESISSNSFVGVNCGSWDNLISANCVGTRAVMGGLGSIDTSARGLYYLETNNNSPFGRS